VCPARVTTGGLSGDGSTFNSLVLLLLLFFHSLKNDLVKRPDVAQMFIAAIITSRNVVLSSENWFESNLNNAVGENNACVVIAARRESEKRTRTASKDV
jgi:hypothetical protein